ncbi:hypothetical protein YPPY52_1844, partial [Yersinia pestis PY-52]
MPSVTRLAPDAN